MSPESLRSESEYTRPYHRLTIVEPMRPLAPENVDVTEINEHILSDNNTVHMSVASFAVLNLVRTKSNDIQDWLYPRERKKGIIADFARTLNLENLITKTAIELCAEEGLLEIHVQRNPRSVNITNARVAEKGRQASDELTPQYKELVASLDSPLRRQKLRDILYEVSHLHKILERPLPEDLVSLQYACEDLNPDKLLEIINTLTSMQINLIEKVDELPKEQRINRRRQLEG